MTLWYRTLVAAAASAAMMAAAGPAFAAGHATVRAASFGTSDGVCPAIDGTEGIPTPYTTPLITYANYTTASGIDTWGVNVSGFNFTGDAVTFSVGYGYPPMYILPITPSPATVNGTAPQWFSFTTPASVDGQPATTIEVSETMPSGNLYASECTSPPLQFNPLNPLPYGQLPEVPWAAALPILGLAAAGVVLYRRRGQSA